MGAGTLFIKTICISPPVVSSSPWPSKVNVNIQAGLCAQAGTPSQKLADFVTDLDVKAAPELGLQGPWLLSSVSSSGGNDQSTVFPTCIHTGGSGHIFVNFRDVEVDSSAAGVVSLALCPAVAVEGAADPGMCVVESAPLLVTATPAATAELNAFFDTMKRLVVEDQHMQAQQILSSNPVVGVGDPRSSSARRTALGSAVCRKPLATAALDSCSLCSVSGACSLCSVGGATAADMDVMHVTWRDNFLLMLLDIQSVLAYAASVGSSCSNSRSHHINSSANKVAASCSVRACLPTAPSLEAASRILVGVLKYLALHGCWCCVSNLLAEAFTSGLLAFTGVLATQQLTEMCREQQMSGLGGSAAATTASLVLSLASLTESADDLQGTLAAAKPTHVRRSRSIVPAAATAANVRTPPKQLRGEGARGKCVVHCSTFSAGSGSSSSYGICSALFTTFLVLLAMLPLICFVPGGLAHVADVVGSNVQLLLVSVQQLLLPVGMKVATCVCILLSALVTGIACGAAGYRCLFCTPL